MPQVFWLPCMLYAIDHLPVTAQAIRLGLSRVEWSGRFQMLPGQPAVVLDVAHNPHSRWQPWRTTWTPWATLRLPVWSWVPWLIKTSRPWCNVCSLWWSTGIFVTCLHNALPRPSSCSRFGKLVHRAKDNRPKPLLTPLPPLGQAMADANPTDRILVFGSFLTVGGVLQHGIAGRLSAQSPPD